MPTALLEPMTIGDRCLLDNDLQTERGAPLGKITVPSDATPQQRMKIVEASGTLDFWNDPSEDGYNFSDNRSV